jgi:hypothetical protein
MINGAWIERSGAIERALSLIPKATEVWFVVCYPEAENVISQFTSKSTENELAWNSNVAKFSEYIAGNTQRATDWDQRRLNLAMRGYFNTKVMFIPTHALLSCVAVFGAQTEKDEYGREKQIISAKLLDEVISDFKNDRWKRKSQAVSFLKTSPLVYLLKGQGAKYGSRRGASSPTEMAEAAFLKVNQFVASGGEGSDQPINRCLAMGLRETLGWDESKLVVETEHPWLKNIRPDLMVLADPNKIICIEMHYTNDKRPYVIADYVLKKMDRYMKEIENRIRNPRLL